VLGYSAEAVRDAERRLIEAGEPLMERAAAGLALQVRRHLPRANFLARTVLVLVGSGDNGGDALFAAADVARSGAGVRFVRLGRRIHEAGLAAALEAGVTEISAEEAPDAARTSHVIVDGILGTGSTASPALRDPARTVVAAIIEVLREKPNTEPGSPHGRPPVVIAADLPSGIHPDTGAVPDPTVLHADMTVTFGVAKAGLLLSPGRELAGEIVVVDIGLAEALGDAVPLVRAGDDGAGA